MTVINTKPGTSRRAFMGGALASGALLLPGCASFGGFSFTDAIRRILYLSSERAFARLTAPGGFWDEQVASLGLEGMLGSRGGVVSSILTSALFKDRLEDAFADIAIEGAERAAPIVADTVRVIGIENAIALVNGGPTAATAFLRNDLGTTLVEAMIPELGDAMRLANEPLVGELLAGLTGIDVRGVANNVSRRVDDAIWAEMGFEEAEIRRNPQATNDPLLIGVFGGARAF
ncbi:DUF4197 domain-containing protein [Aurantiacibacter gangjinensis]|uniref:Uncharacterized protein n=1 Tax=Aurantiacibacter gangjinensis TaxID=502682 RepID=A0A0G9MR80_9SPHN|nr:DUF4197 domain-containing protein [Aurantiacibacter gangjinensis]APE29122.1 hypothetical protein BMF35_a2293 [Aurantiacibacter gangjinensis]KLE33205.1 hypothetical protein AAW01_04350 [Aurantiacibacter gangjinensis]